MGRDEEGDGEEGNEGEVQGERLGDGDKGDRDECEWSERGVEASGEALKAMATPDRWAMVGQPDTLRYSQLLPPLAPTTDTVAAHATFRGRPVGMGCVSGDFRGEVGSAFAGGAPVNVFWGSGSPADPPVKQQLS